jgi:hypothetical protein
MLFLQSYAIQPAPQNKPCISLRVFLFLSCRVSLAEYIRLLGVYPTMLQVKFLAYERWWLTAGGLGDSILISHLYAFVEGCHLCWQCIWNLYCCNHLKVMLFSLIGFETQTCIINYELICNIISTTTPCI